MNVLIEQLQNQSIWDWVVLITGILYVFYAARNNPICWVWGIVSCGVLSVMTVTKYSLYADGILNAFYVVMGFIGLHNWKSGVNSTPIARVSTREVLIYLFIGVICALLSAKFLSTYTQAAATTLDSFTTVFSVIGTIWLVRRYLENWLLWIVVDAVYIYLYLTRGAVLYGLLFVIYTIISIQGYVLWQKELRKDRTKSGAS